MHCSVCEHNYHSLHDGRTMVGVPAVDAVVEKKGGRKKKEVVVLVSEKSQAVAVLDREHVVRVAATRERFDSKTCATVTHIVAHLRHHRSNLALDHHCTPNL